MMIKTEQTTKEFWNRSFDEQIAKSAYNTAPVEAVIRNVSYFLRGRYKPEELNRLHFLEMGCGAGPNLIWLAQKGIRVSGIDISPVALELSKRNLHNAGLEDRIGELREAPVSRVPFENESFDGIIEACVFQHLSKSERLSAFEEVRRLLKPGGLFVGYMLDTAHTIYQKLRADQLGDDPGTLLLQDKSSNIYLSNLGVCHFYTDEELRGLFAGFQMVDPCLTSYYLPVEEAKKRGYDSYLQSMWTVYAIK
jgi:SAM-dependent methyltransferase